MEPTKDEGVQTMYAVIQTGCILPDASITVFKDDAGRRVPAIIAIFADEVKARRMKKRLSGRFARIDKMNNPDMHLTQGVYGVAAVTMDVAAKRKKKDPEAAEGADKPAGGRGRGRGGK